MASVSMQAKPMRMVLVALAFAAVTMAGCVVTPQATFPTTPGTTVNGNLSCPGKIRTHYIAVDEIDWTYAPKDYNIVEDEPYEQQYRIYTDQNENLTGLTYRKAVLHEYTDGTFTQQIPRDPKWEHLGLLGPILHAEVGDTLVIHFKNKASPGKSPIDNHAYSLHPHGVQYDKDSEGAPYADGVGHPEGFRFNMTNGDYVQPGKEWTYEWHATPRSGPGPMDGSSVFWMYHSHVNEVFDVFSGLVGGGIVVTACGMAREDGSPKDVDRELVAYFSIIDENQSWYVDESLELSGKDPAEFDHENPEFMEGNLKHTINGYMFGAGPGFIMTQGERVRWYVMDLGNEVDSHTPHWHGNTLVQNGMRTDMTSIMPGDMRTLDMVPDTPGKWLFHCHVDDHLEAGMVTMYTVLPKEA